MFKTSDNLKCFKIGHANISFCVDNMELIEFIGKWMKDFEVPIDEKQENTIQVRLLNFELDQPLPYSIPKQAKLVHQNDSAKYFLYRDSWIIESHHAGYMIVNRSNRKILGLVYGKFILESLWNFEEYIHPLYELLRQERIYAHHAGAVSYDGFGLLLLGKSGQGKSTLSIDLLNNGFSFLADDSCFVTDHHDSIEMIGFYEPAKVYASNIRHITELNKIEGISSDPAIKSLLDVRLHYPERIELQCKVNALVFPSWSPNEKSKIDILSPGKALVELLPLTMVCLERSTSKTHFQFSGKLVSQIPSIRLIMGNDRENWHKLILEFISSSGRS